MDGYSDFNQMLGGESMSEEKNEIPFNFSYYALDLLGKGLYKNRWSAISELIANGIDAHATKISLYMNLIDKEKAVIEICDNGTGMNYNDLVEKYVFIGRNKRDEELDDSEKNSLMGRKGIGKLAALNLSKKYYLISKTVDESSAWCLNASEVNKSDTPKLKRAKNESIQLESEMNWEQNSTGTMIKLTNVDMTGFGIQSMEGLKLKLSDFYLLNQMNCEIEVAYITSEKEKKNIVFKPVEKKIAFRNFYAFFENIEDNKYKSSLADTVRFPSSFESITEKPRKVLYFNRQDFPEIKGKKKFKDTDGNLSEKEYDYELKGWIGIHTSTKKEDAERNDTSFFRNNAYTPNKLRLYIRDKLVVEDFMTQYIRSTQATSGYIEGEISFDILDVNDLEDITTSDRQGFTHEDDRVQLLIEILKPIVNLLIRERNKMGGQIRKEEEEYREREKEEIRRQKEVEERKRKEEEEKRKVEEEKRREAEHQREVSEKEKEKVNQENEILKTDLKSKDVHLGSEKKRNTFLMSSLTEDKRSFSQKSHMIRINVKAIENTTSFLVNEITKKSPNLNVVKSKLKIISHNTSRIKAIISYVDKATFNIDNEKTEGDLIEFFGEYIENIANQEWEKPHAQVFNPDNSTLSTVFSPQDIGVLIDNLFSNSNKNKAKNIVISVREDEDYCYINFKDDGNGIPSHVTETDELFEFGKGYTKRGTGVGLAHIKDIVNDMGGVVYIPIDNKEGFEIEMKLIK